MNSYTTTFLVNENPDDVFVAISDVRGWWSGDIEGATDKLGSEWTYRYKDVHFSKQRIDEFVPSEKIVWLVIDSFLGFVENKTDFCPTDHIAQS